MIYVLGAALGVSVVYGVLNKKMLEEEERNVKYWVEENWKKEDSVRNLETKVKHYKNQKEIMVCKLQELENSEKHYKIKVDTLVSKVEDLKEQLKLEDEASCRIIKELEDMVAELKRENKLKDDKIAYEIGEKKNYIGYIDYVINAPRAIRRRFANGEKVDWIDENGVLRMRMVEER